MNAQGRPARDALAAARAEKALNMRKIGYGYPAIARECGYSNKASAYNAVQRELERTLQQPADDVRKLEAERLDDLLRAMMPKALKGDTWSVDRVLSIMERRARLLGLDTISEAQRYATPYTKRIIIEQVGQAQPVIDAAVAE